MALFVRFSSIVLFIFAAISVQVSIAEPNVTLHLIQPPVNRMQLGDMWRMTIINQDAVSYSVYLHAFGEEVSTIPHVRIAEGNSREFELTPGTKQIDGNFVQPITIINSSDVTNKYREYIDRTGTVPSGIYQVCVEVIDARTGLILSTFAVDCYDQDIRLENIGQPVLNLPEDFAILEDSLPTFLWMVPNPISPGMQVFYTLKVVEILGVQSPEQAMLANPSFFERSSIRTTMFRYPINAVPIKAERRYAWKVTARASFGAQTENGVPTASAVGESEIFSFTRRTSTSGTGFSDPVLDQATGGNPLSGNSTGGDLITPITLSGSAATDSTSKKKEADKKANNPVEGALLSAGDQHNAAVFDTKSDQKNALENVSKEWDKKGISKVSQSTGKSIVNEMIDKNVNASELTQVASAVGTSQIISTGQNTQAPAGEGSAASALKNLGTGSLNANTSNNLVLDDNSIKLKADSVNSLKRSLSEIAVKRGKENPLWSWGRNVEGQVGFMAPGWYSDIPVPYDIKNVKEIACGANHTLVLLKDGTLWAWGDNQFGQLANTSLRETNIGITISVPGAAKISHIAAGMGTSFALKEDGNLFAWGYNATGELGINDTTHEVTTPTQIELGSLRVTRIAARNGHALAVCSDGGVYAWGSNYFGEVGVGSSKNYLRSPVNVLNSSKTKDAANELGMTVKYKAIACGDHHSLVVSAKGTDLYAWGRNASGQLMNNSTTDTSKPIRSSVSGADTVAGGGAHSLVRTDDKALLVCGNNMCGQLGDGKTGIQSKAQALSSLGPIISMTAGAAHSMVVKKTGGLWTWGNNNTGQLAISPPLDIVFSNKAPIPPTRILMVEQ